MLKKKPSARSQMGNGTVCNCLQTFESINTVGQGLKRFILEIAQMIVIWANVWRIADDKVKLTVRYKCIPPKSFAKLYLGSKFGGIAARNFKRSL